MDHWDKTTLFILYRLLISNPSPMQWREVPKTDYIFQQRRNDNGNLSFGHIPRHSLFQFYFSLSIILTQGSIWMRIDDKPLIFLFNFNFDQRQLKTFVFTLIQSEPEMLIRRKLYRQEFYSICSTINIKRVLFYVINKEQSEWTLQETLQTLV